MANARRVEKINVLMREVVAEIIKRDLQFPEGVLVTVTGVEASEDLYYAAVFVSALGKTSEREKEVMAELRKSTGFVQCELNRKLRMRPVPKITFVIDQGEKRRERIEKLLSGEKTSND